jgi:hypothetical protein
MYEIKCVQSVPNSTTINIGTPLKNSYTTNGNTQIVRIPRFTTLTIPVSQSVSPANWNGATGGVTIIEIQDSAVINGSIDAYGRGFRGGASDNTTQPASMSVNSYFSSNVADGGRKGESIAGSQTTYDLLGGRYGRGAPANGGGGGNTHNAGGGGGANAGIIANYTGYGNPNSSTNNWKRCWDLESTNFSTHTSSGGGRGGYTYAHTNRDARTDGPGNTLWTGNRRQNLGGFGGRPLSYNGSRIFMGGGGGAGDGNNSAANGGTNGGGIIMIICHGKITGTGTITANGETAQNTLSNHNDAPGGGGGGGTIIISSAVNLSNSLTLSANGGDGGNQLITNDESEGPGGGGGYIAISGGSPTVSIIGGINGTTRSNALTEFVHNGATEGGEGTYISNYSSQSIINPFNIYAGSNDTFCTSVFLNANVLSPGNSGTWSILSGTGGNLVNATNPKTEFRGSDTITYRLEWRVTNNLCEVRTDTVTLTPNCSFLSGNWLSFKAEKFGNSNSLFWELASDEGTDKYIIYRSIDGNSFEAIEKIPSLQSYNNVAYEFEDKNVPKNTTCYYEIIRKFSNGTETSSEIVRIDTRQELDIYKVFPNPAHNEVNIKGSNINNKITGWSILAMDGHEVLRSSKYLNESQVNLDLSLIPIGSYIVMIQSSKGDTSPIKFARN